MLDLLDIISEVILAFFFGSCSVEPAEKGVQCSVVFLHAFKLGEQPTFATLSRSIVLIKVQSNLLHFFPDLPFACLALLIEGMLDGIENVVI